MSWPNLRLVCTYVYCKFAMQGFLLFSFKSGRILPIYIGLSQTVTKSSSVAQTSRGTWTEGLSRLPVTSPEHIMLKSLKKKVCLLCSLTDFFLAQISLLPTAGCTRCRQNLCPNTPDSLCCTMTSPGEKHPDISKMQEAFCSVMAG